MAYQATFVLGDWRGRADFLERIEQKTALGPWGYEALDAKLARAEKPTYVLQLCFYTEAIAAIQEATPSAMHVLLGIGERRTLRYLDFDAYYRRVRGGFLAALGRGALYATRENVVDELLRRQIFVDLRGAGRQGLRAGVPGYSLKDVESAAGLAAPGAGGAISSACEGRGMTSRQRAGGNS